MFNHSSLLRKGSALRWRSLLCVALLCCCPLLQARECLSFIYASGGRAFWANLQENIAQEGAKLGYFIYDRGSVDSEHLIDDAQIELLNVAIGRKCRAIILAPSSTIENYNEILRFLPVPVVLIDRNPGLSSQFGSVASDQTAIGTQAWEQLKKRHPDIRRVLVFPNQGKVPSTEQRMAGFAMAAAKDHVSVVYGPELDQSIGRGRQVVRTWLYTQQPQFDAIFTPNESTTSAVLLALRQLQQAGRYPFVGVDRSPLILEAIRSGELLASMVQNTEKMAKIAVQMADDAIHHPSRSGRNILLPPFVLNREVLRNAR